MDVTILLKLFQTTLMNTRDSVRQLESNTGAARWPRQTA